MEIQTKKHDKKKGLAWLGAILSSFAILPSVSAYVQASNTWGPWDIFVENIFGAFWPAVIAIAFFFFIILMLGGISLYTIIIFECYFLFGMSLGYGYPIISVAITAVIIIMAIWQFIKFGENR